MDCGGEVCVGLCMYTHAHVHHVLYPLVDVHAKLEFPLVIRG